jgi:hypothetical protein
LLNLINCPRHWRIDERWRKSKAAILKKNSFKQRKSKALAETADELAAELLKIIYVA